MASLYQYTNKLTFEQSGSYNLWYLSSSAARSSKNFASSLSYWPWKTVNIGNELTKRMYLEHQILKLQIYSHYKKTVIWNEMISKKAEIFCTKKENCWPIKKQIKASFQEQRFFFRMSSLFIIQMKCVLLFSKSPSNSRHATLSSGANVSL